MNPKTALRCFLILASNSLLIISFATAQTTATLTWDTTPGTVGVGNDSITGGTGAWNTTNGNWTSDSGTYNVAWTNVGGASKSDAIIGGTAGPVTLGEAPA